MNKELVDFLAWLCDVGVIDLTAGDGTTTENQVDHRIHQLVLQYLNK